jgi:hypothetical protein
VLGHCNSSNKDFGIKAQVHNHDMPRSFRKTCALCLVFRPKPSLLSPSHRTALSIIQRSASSCVEKAPIG